VICLAAGAMGGLVTGPAVKTWYPTLQKPSWNPPSWLFAPVWTVLYVLMAIAAWLVWRAGLFFGTPGILFGLQLILNMLWSWFFFGKHRPDQSFAEILVLWVSILATAVAFVQVNLVAGWLFVPYLLWVTFAAVLNGTIWRMNPELGRAG